MTLTTIAFHALNEPHAVDSNVLTFICSLSGEKSKKASDLDIDVMFYSLELNLCFVHLRRFCSLKNDNEEMFFYQFIFQSCCDG